MQIWGSSTCDLVFNVPVLPAAPSPRPAPPAIPLLHPIHPAASAPRAAVAAGGNAGRSRLTYCGCDDGEPDGLVFRVGPEFEEEAQVEAAVAAAVAALNALVIVNGGRAPLEGTVAGKTTSCEYADGPFHTSSPSSQVAPASSLRRTVMLARPDDVASFDRNSVPAVVTAELAPAPAPAAVILILILCRNRRRVRRPRALRCCRFTRRRWRHHRRRDDGASSRVVEPRVGLERAAEELPDLGERELRPAVRSAAVHSHRPVWQQRHAALVEASTGAEWFQVAPMSLLKYRNALCLVAGEADRLGGGPGSFSFSFLLPLLWLL